MACEVATYRDDSMFAATPPLEALRLLLSHATEREPRGGTRGPKKVLLMDVRKAHLHAASEREVYVHLPPELKSQPPGKCWLLRRCLYGTRDAPVHWEALYTKELKTMGFRPGKASSCCFYHPSRGIRALVHGDDFTFVGADKELDWAQLQMQKAFLCKVEGRLGPEPGDTKQARILNRVVSWKKRGIEYEADPRHAEILVASLEVTQKEKVVSPGVKTRVEEYSDPLKMAPLGEQEAAAFESTGRSRQLPGSG